MVKLIEVKESNTRKPLVVELSVEECQAIRDLCGSIVGRNDFRDTADGLFYFFEMNGYSMTYTSFIGDIEVHND